MSLKLLLFGSMSIGSHTVSALWLRMEPCIKMKDREREKMEEKKERKNRGVGGRCWLIQMHVSAGLHRSRSVGELDGRVAGCCGAASGPVQQEFNS